MTVKRRRGRPRKLATERSEIDPDDPVDDLPRDDFDDVDLRRLQIETSSGVYASRRRD